MNTKNRKILINMCLIGLFSALCYVGVLINIPIPSPLGKPIPWYHFPVRRPRSRYPFGCPLR